MLTAQSLWKYLSWLFKEIQFCARKLKMVGLGNMKFVWVTILGKLGPVFGVHQY